jgi:triosephosphate isomerase (TIM)
MRKKLVVGNWKMNGSLASNAALLAGLRSAGLRSADLSAAADVAVCAPYPYLSQVQSALSGGGLRWGAQNLSEHAAGAHTGEVGASMLLEFGCSVVIVGHSERRAMYGEDDATVARKAKAALGAGMTPIVCVGETLVEREAGRTSQVVARQLGVVLDTLGAEGAAASVIAYEPVWAIGTGRTATPEQAQEVHADIRAQVAMLDPSVAAKMRILYGGSVKGSNASELFSKPDVDGGLIGGASLVLTDFLAICSAGRIV